MNALILEEKNSEFFIQGITYLLLKPTHLKQSKQNNFNLIQIKHVGMDSVTSLLRYGGVSSSGDLANKVKRRKSTNNQSLESKEKYSHYLCFTVSVRSNDLLFEYNKDKQSIDSKNIYKIFFHPNLRLKIFFY